MAITLVNSYTSNFGDDWTTTFNIASVAASSGNVIFAAYSTRSTGNQIAAAPTWNGETFTLLHSSANESSQVNVYTLKCTTSATATVNCAPTDWSQGAGIVCVYSGDIASSGTFLTPVVSFEDSTTTPWAAPSSSITTTTADLVLDFLFAANQDAVGDNLTGGTFTQGGGQSTPISIAHANNYIGNVLNSSKAGASSSTATSWTLSQQPRYVYVLTGIAGTSGASVDTYPATVRSGQTGIAYATTGLSSVSAITVGSLSATSLSDTSGDGTHALPGLVDTVAHQLYGTKTVTVTGVGGTPTTSTSFLPPTGWDYVTLSGTLNTTTTGVLNSFSPAAVVTDQIVFETANGSVDAQGNYSGDFDGTQTMWHIKASDGVARSYSVVTGDTGVTFNITGLSTSTAHGTITGSSGGVIKVITGLSMTASRGTISAVSGGISYLITGLQALMFAGNVTSPNGNVPSSGNEDTLPQFINKMVKLFKASIRKPFRKK